MNAINVDQELLFALQNTTLSASSYNQFSTRCSLQLTHSVHLPAAWLPGYYGRSVWKPCLSQGRQYLLLSLYLLRQLAVRRKQSGCLGMICLWQIQVSCYHSLSFPGGLSQHLKNNSSSICSIIFPRRPGWGWLPWLSHIFLAHLEDNMTFVFYRVIRNFPPLPLHFKESDSGFQWRWSPLPAPVDAAGQGPWTYVCPACRNGALQLPLSLQCKDFSTSLSFGFPIPILHVQETFLFPPG